MALKNLPILPIPFIPQTNYQRSKIIKKNAKKLNFKGEEEKFVK